MKYVWFLNIWIFPANMRLLRFSNIWIFAPKMRFLMFSPQLWNIWSCFKRQFFRNSHISCKTRGFPLVPWLKRKWQDNALQCVCANHLVGEPAAFLLLRRWTLVRSLGNSLDARNVSSACFLSFCVTRTKDWQLSFSLLTSMPYICIRYYYVSIKNCLQWDTEYISVFRDQNYFS